METLALKFKTKYSNIYKPKKFNYKCHKNK